jgi:hypothetical protein
MINHRGKTLILLGASLLLLAVIIVACGPTITPPPSLTEEAPPPTEPSPPTEPAAPTEPPPPTNTPETEEIEVTAEIGAAVKAVDLLAAWVAAGAPESESFDYIGLDENTYQGTFEVDILPLFTENSIWFEGSQACTGCHFAVSETSYHELDLTTHEGILLGADSLSDPDDPEAIIEPGDWGASSLRARLRNNRMPPGFPFDITEANRDGQCVEVSAEGAQVLVGEFGCELNAVGLIGAWVDAGAPEGEFTYGDAQLNFERDVLPLFTEADMWFEGSQACTGCHFAVSENSYHEMDLTTYEGILLGADALSDPDDPEAIIEPGDWGASSLRARLRNNRMPTGFPFDITEANRDGPLVLHGERVETAEEVAGVQLFGTGECEVNAVHLIGAWVDADAPEGEAFDFESGDGDACSGTFEADVLPLFTQNGVWFEGSQACTGCHFAVSETSYHEMDLTTHEGILLGADSLSDPDDPEAIIEPGDWGASSLRARLRNNRMPPGFPFDITEANRDGQCVEVSAEGAQVLVGEFGCELNAVGLIGAWVDAGAPEGEFTYGDAQLNFERDVLPLFTEADMWFEGSQACTGCHFAVSENSYHEMDLTTYEGILLGADALSDPDDPEAIIEPGDWGASSLRARLRNNRMPPGSPFDITEGNRDGPVVLAGTKN